MSDTIKYQSMVEQDIDELAAVLLDDSVYQYIGGMPSYKNFRLGLQRALQGPPSAQTGELWLNYVARLSSTGELLGRLEATSCMTVWQKSLFFMAHITGAVDSQLMACAGSMTSCNDAGK